MLPKDITGHRFGGWTVLSKSACKNYGHTHWLCRCDCGEERIVENGNLRSRRSESCGCVRRIAPLGKPGCDKPLTWIEAHANFNGDECLLWPFIRSPQGYGKVRVNGSLMHASRYMCERVNGSPPTPKHEAAHSCGKGHEGCINPKHLSWKTPKENTADQLIHGTRIRGDQHNFAKLSESAVWLIRHLRAAGYIPNKDLAQGYGVSPATISMIASGKTWGHLR